MKRSDDLDDMKFDRFVTGVCVLVFVCVFGYAIFPDVIAWLVG